MAYHSAKDHQTPAQSSLKLTNWWQFEREGGDRNQVK
ncbi:hypothetical protein CCACVL1_24838 [Corchorus capsularis]|uniref:Uncharacterized protein n=1 Tax=Corchorus capsularis TaxID=210143 RepID=A0A1R3GMX9_COCAP|nr:hypothetical protein CCACVL1_24838 [Corchorus capsularis]